MATNDNPYQPPQAALTQDAAGGTAGNVEDALAGNYDFEIGDVLREAWSRVAGSKRVFLLAGLAVFLAMMAASIVLTMIIPGARAAHPGLIPQAIMQFATTVIAYPFLVGMTMLGIKRAAGQSIEIGQAFGYFHLAVPVAITAVLITLLTSVGFLLLIVPGIYLSIGYLFALPLIADKNLGPWEAMETSRRAVTHHWFKVCGVLFALAIVMGAPLIVASLLFAAAASGASALGVLGFLLVAAFVAIVTWVGPLMMISIGVLYRIIFGIEAPTLRGA